MGIPNRVAEMMMTAIGKTTPAPCIEVANPSPIGSASPRLANRRPQPLSEECQMSRKAMRARAAGMMHIAVQTGIPQATMVGASYSNLTRSKLAQASQAATPAPTAPVKIRTELRAVSGRKLTVESASIRSDRVASAAPRNAIQRVRCSTRGMEPDIPRPKSLRPRISNTGSSAITNRTETEKRFSILSFVL